VSDPIQPPLAGGVDVAEYCRRVEEHLARVNSGHLVRVVGPAFSLVRAWADAGIPFTVVCRGIDRKAERHLKGKSRRPLRLEFCEADVRDAFDEWRRAVGVTAQPEPDLVDGPSPAEERRRPSTTRALDRAIEKLVRATGNLDASEGFRTETSAVLEQLVRVREGLKHARGDARSQVLDSLSGAHRTLVEAARREAADQIAAFEADAAADLAAYRSRLAPDAWRRAIAASVDRSLLERLGLPSLGPDAVPGLEE
jgi:hypothetical protein